MNVHNNEDKIISMTNKHIYKTNKYSSKINKYSFKINVNIIILIPD